MLPSGTRVRTRADGTLADTPLAHVLIYIRNKRLTGTLLLRASGDREARFDFWRGSVVTAQTTPVVARFGSVVYELSMIDAETLNEATATSGREKLPVADILLGSKAITRDQRDEVLVEQIRRRVHYTFTFPPDAQFTFQERSPATIEPPLIVDLLAPIWRGILDFPPELQIAAVLSRLNQSGLEATRLMLVSEAALERAGLSDSEQRLCEALAHTPMTCRGLREKFGGAVRTIDQLLYFLVISKCAQPDLVAAPAAAPAPAPATTTTATRRRSFVLSSTNMPAASTAPKPIASRPAIIVSPADLGIEGIRIRASNLAFETAYEALGLLPGASEEAARAAYVRLSRLWHPDHLPLGLGPVEPDALLIFKHINDAYRTITETRELTTDVDDVTEGVG